MPRQDDATLALTKQLIAAQSVTPNDAGCQMLMTERLSAIGFEIEALNFSDKHLSLIHI